MLLLFRTRRVTAVRAVLAASSALTQAVAPLPALAQAQPAPTSIAPACVTALDGDIRRDGRTGRLLELRAETVAETDGGVLLFVPAECLAQAAVVLPKSQTPDANAQARSAVNNVRDALLERGAEREQVAKGFQDLDRTLDIQYFETTDEVEGEFDNFARDRARGFQNTGSEDTGNSAIAAMAVAGCVAMTGGAACAIIPAVLGGLFGTDVTTEDVETAQQVVDSMREGRPIPDSARDHLRQRGVDDGVIDTADAFSAGNMDDVVVAVGAVAGLDARETDMLKAVVDAARSGALTCADVRTAAKGSINRRLQLDTRARRDLRATVARALAQAGGAEAVARAEPALNCLDDLVAS